MESMEISKGNIDKNFWKGKKVFLTGHTGFKGSWLSLWLQNMEVLVKGYSLDVNTKPALFTQANVAGGMESEIGDIRNLEQLTESMVSFSPDILIHMAAQPLVRLSYQEPVDTYTTNVIGTVNVLEAARKCSALKAMVSVTTDKCYENKEWDWGYRESEPMGGHDPYSSSKGCAELVISAYRRSFFSSEGTASLASARAGNVIGGGDWAEDRLIPDILRAFEKSETVVIRNPLSTRPWQHVLEPLSGYLSLGAELYKEESLNRNTSFNFGPDSKVNKNVGELIDEMKDLWKNSPGWINKFIDDGKPEANLLKLCCDRANILLEWYPVMGFEETIEFTMSWYTNYYIDKNSVFDYTMKQINDYTSKAKNQNIKWAQ